MRRAAKSAAKRAWAGSLFATTITLLTAGRVVQRGTFADLVDRPATPFVTQFLTAQTLAAGAPASR